VKFCTVKLKCSYCLWWCCAASAKEKRELYGCQKTHSDQSSTMCFAFVAQKIHVSIITQFGYVLTDRRQIQLKENILLNVSCHSSGSDIWTLPSVKAVCILLWSSNIMTSDVDWQTVWYLLGGAAETAVERSQHMSSLTMCLTWRLYVWLLQTSHPQKGSSTSLLQWWCIMVVDLVQGTTLPIAGIHVLVV